LGEFFPLFSNFLEKFSAAKKKIMPGDATQVAKVDQGDLESKNIIK